MSICVYNISCADYDSITPETAEWKYLNSDSSILGWGSLAAFFASAFLTVIAIFVAYFTDSLNDGLLTDVDQVVIAEWPKLLVPRRHQYWARMVRWVRSVAVLLRIRPETGLTPAIRKPLRIEALQRFVLALSDQQLLAGNAMLIGALADSCNISQFEFTLVVAMAWFSTITHLASLSMLEMYFRTNYELAGFRILFMGVNLVLLSYGLVVRDYAPRVDHSWKLRQSVPLICVLRTKSTFFRPKGVTIVAMLLVTYLFVARVLNLTLVSRLRNWLQEELEPKSSGQSPARSSTAGSNDSLKDLEMLKDIPQHPFATALQLLYVRLRYPRKPKHRRSFERQLYHSRVSRQMRIEATVHTILSKWPQQWYCVLRPRLFRYYVGRMSETFASQVPALLFALAYGLTQVLSLRLRAQIPEEARGVDFGQLVALFLLALPVLAAAETYYESIHNNEIASGSTTTVYQLDDTSQAHRSQTPSLLHVSQDAQQRIATTALAPRSNTVMTAEEIDYRHKRLENTTKLYKSTWGTIWVRIYILLSVPLPIMLGVAMSLVRSSLILIGLLIFAIPFITFLDSLATSVIELVRATKKYNEGRNAPDHVQLDTLSTGTHHVATHTFFSEPILRTDSPQDMDPEIDALIDRRVVKHANTIAVSDRRKWKRPDDSETDNSDMDFQPPQRTDTEGGWRYGKPNKKQAKLHRTSLTTIPSHDDSGARPGGIVVREQEVGSSAAAASAKAQTGAISRRTTGGENVLPNKA